MLYTEACLLCVCEDGAHVLMFNCVSDLKNEPYRRADAVRRSQRRHGDNHLKVNAPSPPLPRIV